MSAPTAHYRSRRERQSHCSVTVAAEVDVALHSDEPSPFEVLQRGLSASFRETGPSASIRWLTTLPASRRRAWPRRQR